MRAFVISSGDCLETLLTCCVPNIKFNLFIEHLDIFYFKVNADGGKKCFVENIVGKPEQDVTLADRRIADY